MAIDKVKVWARYQILEEEFLKFERYVPYSQYHSTVTSPVLDVSLSGFVHSLNLSSKMPPIV